MSSKFKLVIVMMAVLFAVVFVAGAQAQGNDTTEAPGTTWTPGMGMMRGGFGSSPMFEAVAGALGIDTATLTSELQSGKTIAQIAEANNVELQTVYDAALSVMEQHMSAMVTAGYLTQAQMDARLSLMSDNIAQMPMFTGMGFGGQRMGGMMDDSMGWGMGGRHHGNWDRGMMGQGGRGHGGMSGCMMNCQWDS